MKANMGNLDRLIRLVSAAVMMTLVLTNQVSGVWGYVLTGLSAVFAFTSLIRFCPLYIPFGINTCKSK